MRYNYVFFDLDTEYYRIARHDLENLDWCRIRTKILLDEKRKWMQILFRAHTSKKLNSRINMPFQSIWNKYMIGELDFANNKPICFVFACSYVEFRDMGTYRYLRKKYPDCKIVFVLRDFISIEARNKCFAINEMRDTFDEIFTISDSESKRYGFCKIQVMCSSYPVEMSERDIKSDVVFVGKVKDRLDVVVEAYKLLYKAGLVCDFTLVHSEPIQNLPVGIAVRKEPMPYTEMLQRVVNSKCVFEVTQKGIGAMTSRVLEALCYNKKLISDNMELSKLSYYKEEYMQLFEDVTMIDPDFVKADIEVNYDYKNDFSPIRMLQIVDERLKTLDSEREEVQND